MNVIPKHIILLKVVRFIPFLFMKLVEAIGASVEIRIFHTIFKLEDVFQISNCAFRVSHSYHVRCASLYFNKLTAKFGIYYKMIFQEYLATF